MNFCNLIESPRVRLIFRRHDKPAVIGARVNLDARRDAAENLEFWTNKTAFLSNIYRGAFWDER